MKKLIASVLFVAIGLFAVDRLGGMLMWWVNQHTHDVSGPKMKYLVNDIHEDILLMGTSRCDLHYVPSVISDTLGLSVYNGGINASENIYSHYIILNHILAIHKPKVICLKVMNNDVMMQNDPFCATTFFAPYFGRNERADSVFLLAGSYWKYRLSHLYRYNAKAVSNIAGLVINRHEGGENGYIPFPKPAHFPDSLVRRKTQHSVDSLKLEYVQRFINLCKENGVRLIFVVSPMYTEIDANYYDVLKSIARCNDIPFLDYHTEGLYHDHPEYFMDNDHLWDKGARKYSSVFAHDLKKLINNK